MKIKLSELTMVLEDQIDDSYTVYDTQNETTLMVWDGMVNGDYDPDLIEDIEDSDQYISMPDKYDIHEYEIMESYIKKLPSGNLQDKLWNAIQGKGAFRRFKDVLYDFDKANDWFRYLEASYEEIGREWAKTNHVEIEEDIPSKLKYLNIETKEFDYKKASKYWIEKDQQSKSINRKTLRNEIEKFIQSHNTCALATGFDTFIRCTPIEYTYLNQCFYLFSEGGLKFKGLEENKNVCLAIFEEYSGFGNLKGMQVMGQASLIEPFSDEYLKLLDYKKISKSAIEKMDHPMNLIKVVPTQIDFLNSDFVKEGYSSRQHSNF